jgi:hypothetical protein
MILFEGIELKDIKYKSLYIVLKIYITTQINARMLLSYDYDTFMNDI